MLPAEVKLAFSAHFLRFSPILCALGLFEAAIGPAPVIFSVFPTLADFVGVYLYTVTAVEPSNNTFYILPTNPYPFDKLFLTDTSTQEAFWFRADGNVRFDDDFLQFIDWLMLCSQLYSSNATNRDRIVRASSVISTTEPIEDASKFNTNFPIVPATLLRNHLVFYTNGTILSLDRTTGSIQVLFESIDFNASVNGPRTVRVEDCDYLNQAASPEYAIVTLSYDDNASVVSFSTNGTHTSGLYRQAYSAPLPLQNLYRQSSWYGGFQARCMTFIQYQGSVQYDPEEMIRNSSCTSDCARIVFHAATSGTRINSFAVTQDVVFYATNLDLFHANTSTMYLRSLYDGAPAVGISAMTPIPSLSSPSIYFTTIGPWRGGLSSLLVLKHALPV